MTLTQRTDHIAQGVSLLVTQYEDSPNLQVMLSSYLEQVQDIEDVAFQILDIIIDQDAQVGDQLDLLGALIGQPREGRIDADYLVWIKARKLVNISSGLPDDLMGVLHLIVPNNDNFFTEYFPAAFSLTIVGAYSGDIDPVAEILGETRGGGIKGGIIYSAQATADLFLWSTGDTEEASTTQGWSDDAQSNGGYFCDVEEL